MRSGRGDRHGDRHVEQQRDPVVDDGCNALGWTSVTTTGLVTKGNDLVVAHFSADGPAKGGQTVTVSGSGLTWTRVANENGAAGDAGCGSRTPGPRRPST